MIGSRIGSGHLYDLLEQFTKEGMIYETKIEGRRRSYRITEKGRRMLDAEYQRLSLQVADYARICKGRYAGNERTQKRNQMRFGGVSIQR